MRTLALFTLLSFSALAADLPQVQAPSELTNGEFAEGTVTRLSSAEVAEFLPWAQNARNQLERGMKVAQSLPLRERLPHIERVVKGVVSRSGSRQYQALMRFALNRGLLLVDELEKSANMNDVGSQENALDLLQRSIVVGLSFYESDLTFQQRAQSGQASTVIPYARFATLFMQNMYPGVVNVLDATAQYRLLYKLVEMVNWDLSRDAEAPKYADTIVEAYELGQDLPEQSASDDKLNLRFIRRLNSLKIIQLRDATTAGNAQNVNEADNLSTISAPGSLGGSNTARNGFRAFDYDSSTRLCYPVDRDGNRMGTWGNTADISNCTVGVSSFDYDSSTRLCYRVDAEGKRLGTWGQSVDMSQCVKGRASFAYDSSTRLCYNTDGRGKRLGTWGQSLPIESCMAGYKTFAYDSSTNLCYRVDSDNRRLGTWGQSVDLRHCQ